MVETLAQLGRAARKIGTRKYITLSAWAILAAIGGLFANKVVNATTVSVSAPHGSPSMDAQEVFQKYFPDGGQSTDFAALVKCAAGCGNNSILAVPSVAHFSTALFQDLAGSLDGQLISFSSYFLLVEQGVPDEIARKQFVAPTGEATLITWTIKGDNTKHAARKKAVHFQHLVERLEKKWLGDSGIEILLSGVPLDINAAVTTAEAVMEHMDMRSLPIAIVVSGAVVRSMRLMVIPLLLLGISLSISFAFLYAMSSYTVIESSTPPMMMSLMVAMSFDYSLFICTRFREELGARFLKAEILLGGDDASTVADKVMDAIEATFSTAGFTVLLSGMTLTASFFILMVCPVGLVFSMGSGCAFALFVTNMAALSVPPALFATFPAFFAQSRTVSKGAASTDSCQKYSDKLWWFLARMTSQWPWNVIVILVVSSSTLALASKTFWDPGLKISDSMGLNIPYHTELAAATDDTAKIFGKGKMLPYKLIMVPRNKSEGILSMDGVSWEKSISIVNALVLDPNLHQTSPEDFSFAFYSNGKATTWDSFEPCLLNTQASACGPVVKGVSQFVNQAGTATYGYISLQWDPLSPTGQKWLEKMRRNLKDLGDETGFDLYLSGFAAESWDMIHQIYALFPSMIVSSLSVAFLLLALAFRSVVLPLRSIMSILLTLGFVFGLAVASYQEGCFDWTGMHGVSSKAGGISFFLPFLVFSVVMGICLDYDIFLLARTVEVCEQTCDTRMAIQQSLVATGGIITSAGIIMMLAFGGLMLSSMWTLCQMGFFLAMAAFYDTFIVRTLVSPATMGLLGDWHWWPGPLFTKTRTARLLALDVKEQHQRFVQKPRIEPSSWLQSSFSVHSMDQSSCSSEVPKDADEGSLGSTDEENLIGLAGA